jgi:hypothetical protein
VTFALSNPVGTTLTSPGTTLLTILDNDSGTAAINPDDDAQFFVRQHYSDFLSRVPDDGGLAFWTSEISRCGTDQSCVRRKRIDVSNAFFYELEFQRTGAYVFRLYRAAYGNDQPASNSDPGNITEAKKIPAYDVFIRDRARVVDGSDLAQQQLAVAKAFTLRSEFLSRYPAGLMGSQFVDAVLATIQTASNVNLASQRNNLITQSNQGGRGRVLYVLADDNVQANPIDNRA